MKRILTLVAVTGALGGCGAMETPMTLEAQAQSRATPRYNNEMRHAIQWVTANAGGDHDPLPSKKFPGLNCGNVGLKAYAMHPEEGQGLIDFNRAIWTYLPKVTIDPKKHMALMVVATWDEPVTYTAIMDRHSGRTRLYGKFKILDGGHDLTNSAFNTIFPHFEGDRNDGWSLLADFIKRSTWLKLTAQDEYWESV